MDTLSHIMSFLLKLSKCSKIGYRAFSLDIITAVLGTNWIWKPASYFEAYCSSSVNYFDPHFLLTTLMERCTDVAPTVRIRAISALCGLFETLSDTSPPAKCELLLSSALGTLVTEKSGRGKSPSSQKSKNTSVSQKSLIEIFRDCAMDDKPLVRSKSVQALGSALTLSWPKYVSAEEARYKQFESRSPAKSVATSSASNNNATGGADSAHADIEFVTMFVAEEDILVLVEKCNDSSLAVRKQAVTALSDLARSRTADSAILDAWVAAVLPMITDPESSVQVKVALSVQEILLDAVLSWARDVNQSYQGKKAKAAASAEEGDMYNPMDMSNIDTECNGAWHILMRVSSTGQTKMLKANIAALVKQGVVAVDGVTVPSYNATGIPSSTPKLRMKDIIEAAKTACCFGIRDSSSHKEMDYEDMSATEVIAKSGWVLLESLVGQQYVFDDSTYFRNRKLDKTSVDFVVKCFAHKRQKSRQILDEDDIRMLQVLEQLADNMLEDDILSMREELFPLLQSFSLTTDATSAGISAMYSLSRALAKHQHFPGEGDPTLTPGGSKKKNKNSKSHRDSRGGLAAVDDMTDEQKAFWCNDVREWCGKLLATAYVILDSYVQNKTLPVPANPASKKSGNKSSVIPCGLEGMPPAELSQSIVAAMNNTGLSIAFPCSYSFSST